MRGGGKMKMIKIEKAVINIGVGRSWASSPRRSQ
jgi:ribosomal protein L5